MNKNIIEERATNDPEVAEYMRAEIARIEKDANDQLQEHIDKLLREARHEIQSSAKRAAKNVEERRLNRAYQAGRKAGFERATALIATLSLVIYLFLNIL